MASRARDAATNAGEWVPIFQREAIETPPIRQSRTLEAASPASASGTPSGAERPARPRKRAAESEEMTPSTSKGNGADALSSPAPEIDQTENDAI